jgi:hypothetical protein
MFSVVADSVSAVKTRSAAAKNRRIEDVLFMNKLKNVNPKRNPS